MRIAILGPLDVADDTRSVPVPGTRLRALLIRLALEPGRPVSVRTLIDDLWPEAAPKRPEHALQELVSRLRRTLPADVPLRAAAGGYLLDIAAPAVDAHRFERLVRGGILRLDRGDRVAIPQLREALSLWRGPALTDVSALPFAAAAAAHLDELRLIATESAVAAELAIRPGDPLLITELTGLLTAHPLRERPRLLHMQALHAASRTPEALTSYDHYRTLLATELGMDPSPELADLHLKLLRGERPTHTAAGKSEGFEQRLRESTPAYRDSAIGPTAAASPAARLRVPLTSLIGREHDLTEVVQRVGDSRLVTLVGPGGAGKTRLAVAVAGELSGHVVGRKGGPVPGEPDREAEGTASGPVEGAAAGRFAGGVGLAELAAVSDSSDLPHAVAGALGVALSRTAERSGGDPVGLLAEGLPTAPTLLVLDNCEHLVDEVARFVADLLGRVPALRIVATSRQPLGIGGETLWETAPLAVPPADSDDVADFPSVRLFLDRATAVRAELTPTEGVLETVAEICRHLDGLPLALELAAAKLRAMPLPVLRDRLDDRFTVLAGGSRTALPRHRTLRAVLDWDWELLIEKERTALARLSVFPAPFTPHAAEGLGVATSEIEALLDKSLVQLVDVLTADPALPTPQPRYRMLESVRAYGREHLTARGELDSTRSAHAAYHLALAEAAHPHLRGHTQLPWLRLLDAHRDHLIAALRFAQESADADTAARLGSALGMYWALHANHTDAVRLLRPILELPTTHPHPPLAAAFALHSMLAAQATELTAAADHIRRWTGVTFAPSTTTTPTPGSPAESAPGQSEPGPAAPGQSSAGPARNSTESTRSATGPARNSTESIWRVPESTWSATESASGSADSVTADGAAELAWALVELAAERVDVGLGVVEPWLGHPDAWTRGMFWLVRSFLHANESGVARLDADLRMAAACFEEAGERWGWSTALTYLAFARAALGDFGGAEAAMASALVAAEELGRPVALRVWLVMIRLHSGEVDAARTDLSALAEETLSAGDTVMTRLLAADVARFDGDLAESARCLRRVESDLGRAVREDRSYRAMFGLRMGLLRAAEGSAAAAATHCSDAWANAVAVRDLPLAAEVAVGVARACLAAGAASASAEALGAGHALRGAPDARHPDIEALRTELAAVLGSDHATAVYERARVLPRDAALMAVEASLRTVSDGNSDNRG
ncbi:BTAD domain-containing putative transcriptional regulator [Nocardia sp. NPDC004151]|uniref:AfsR/SARP family transcriptional regulator n=1 Tax=Nocardia sp. NPDC004151 TaxID=3364304 RepID=UPI0036A23ED0